jgi:hypothetical protein
MPSTVTAAVRRCDSVAFALLLALGLCGCTLDLSRFTVIDDEAEDGSRDGGTEAGIASAGQACEESGERACAGHDGGQPLVCRAGTWQPELPCTSTERCDTSAGPNRGVCQPLAAECMGRKHAEPFCAGDVLRECIDLVTFTDTPCGTHATCTAAGGMPECTCKPGFEDAAGACVDIAECAANNGGCDLLTTCTENVGAAPTCGACPEFYSGTGAAGCVDSAECTTSNGGCDPLTTCTENEGAAPTCGACPPFYSGTGATGCVDIAECATNNGGCAPLTACIENEGAAPGCGGCLAGYLGDGPSGCVPTVTGLVLSSGTLAPALSSDATSYTVAVGIATQTLSITPSVPPGATVTIDGEPVDQGTPWQSPVLDLGDNPITIEVSQTGQPSRSYTLTVTRGYQTQAYLQASTKGAGDLFGFRASLSADGNTLAVGAVEEDSSATGANGDQANNGAGISGAVYVFTRSAATWAQQAYIKASNTDAQDRFGGAVSLSADGNTLAVGAYDEDSSATGVDSDQTDNTLVSAGAAYVFTRSGETWSQQAYLKASNTGDGDAFGFSVSLASDGNTLAVGAHYEDSSTTGVNGNQADDSSSYSGAVYLFTRSAATWTQQAYLKANNTTGGDRFGFVVSLASDGNTLAVGAHYEDSSTTGVNGDQADNTVADSGAVYVFTRSGTAWTQQAYIKASNTTAGDMFGGAVSLSSDGNTLAVGAAEEDSSATGVDGDQTDNSAANSGAVYVYTRSGTTWTQQAYLKASNTGDIDVFGYSVSLSSDGNTLAVGAPREASSATGVDGDQTDNSAADSGAVYVFTQSAPIWTQQAYLKASGTVWLGSAVSLSSDGNTLAAGTRSEASYVFR